MDAERRLRLSRRGFLVVTGAGTVAVGLGGGYALLRPAASREGQVINAFLSILPDGRAEVVCPAMNLGQGAAHALAMVVAEELGADPARVSVRQAPRDPAVYGNPEFGGRMVSADSKTTAGYWAILRLAGTEGRRALVATACRDRGWRPQDCSTNGSAVLHEPSGERVDFGTIARAGRLRLPGATAGDLERRSAFTLVGHSPENPEHREIVAGRKRFGVDRRDEDMLVAVLAMSPHLGGQVVSVDDREARQVPGVEAVVRLDDAVAVVAHHTWAALKGREALKVVWSAPGGFSSADEEAELARALDDPGRPCVRLRDTGLAPGTPTLTAEFHAPALKHILPEPLNASARATLGGLGVAVAGSTQSLDLDMRFAARSWKTAPFLVSTTGHPSGGAYGRRVLNDAVRDAARVAKVLGKPVQVIRPMLDELRRGQVRPAALQRLSATLDGTGALAGWQHDIASDGTLAAHLPSSLKGSNGDEDNTATDGAYHPYWVRHERIRWTRVASEPLPGFLRGVSAGYTVWAIETMMERLARHSGQDPLAFRLRHLDDPRLSVVLERVAVEARWGEPGRHLGLGVMSFRGSAVATIAEVVGRSVVALWIVADVGAIVHRDQVHGQIEGGAIWGLSMALYERLDFTQGAARIDSLGDYAMVTNDRLPPIRIVLLEPAGDAMPCGVGEIGVPTVIPAVCNAFEAATAERYGRLPLALQ